MLRKYSSVPVFVVVALLASCSTTDKYAVLSEGETQIAGHPYKTAKDCKRKAPIGRFDPDCDIPVIGFRGFTDPTIGVQSGGTGSFGF